MAKQVFCIHGHFYQPPREDPLTGEIPTEPGSAPYVNWNERILAHCYTPNAQLKNFEHISFNLGPTLVEWMSKRSPQTLNAIASQVWANIERYGVGNAMAQAYNHTILPLSSRLDKQTQVRWGLASFQHFFGHKPQGMWLPEAAVDDETLEILVECGIEFTILAPWQAGDPNLDTTQPYRVNLRNGKTIHVFFYQQDLSTRVSFDPGSTVNADRFALEFLLPRFRPEKVDLPQIVMVASDGELYGHHQPFRDQFLARLMDGSISGLPIEAIFPALWLKRFPSANTTTIRPNTSWSCHHGVSRWKEGCDCTPNSRWKAPLREALDQLAIRLDEYFFLAAQSWVPDPWELRHEYIKVLLGEESLPDLIKRLGGSKLTDEDLRKATLLLQAQYERQRMFTSCGWFFEDFDRIEPRNNVCYAAQATWLNYQATGVNLTPLARTLLHQVSSSRSHLRADEVFDRHYQRASARG
ncbi:MAG TPA: DUF3536 domain-containing protein [Anaerolineaceae bacterium]